MVLGAILLAVLAGGLLLGLSRARLRALLAGAWLAALVLALILPRALSLRLLGWDWRAMLIATVLGLLVALYVRLIRRARRQSGAGSLREEAEAARAEGAALQADIEAARARARAEAMRPPAPDIPPVLVMAPGRVAAPLCLALADAGVARIALAGAGADAVARAVSALYPACHVSESTPELADCALVLAVADGTDPGRACLRAGVPLVQGWLAGSRAHAVVWHPAAGGSCPECDPVAAGSEAAAADDPAPEDGPFLAALMASAALALRDGPGAREATGCRLSLDIRRDMPRRNPACPPCAPPRPSADTPEGEG